MYNRVFLTILFSAFFYAPTTVLSEEIKEPIQFRVTDTTTIGAVQNVHVACSPQSNTDDILCNLTYSTLKYQTKIDNKPGNCTVNVLPINPAQFHNTESNVWEHTSAPDTLLCGRISKFKIEKDPSKTPFFRWTLTEYSEETDMSGPLCKNRSAFKRITKYNTAESAEISCASLSFNPGLF